MRSGAAISHTAEAGLAAAEAADAAAQALGGASCTLAVVFVTPPHLDQLEAVALAVESRLEPTTIVGGVASGVVGPGTESEGDPAVSVWCAAFEGGHAEPFRSWSVSASDDRVVVAGVPDTRPGDVALLLADPFTYPAPQVVARLGEERPGHAIVGGLVTGGPGRSRLVLGTEVHADGAVGAVLRDVAVDTLVSQGCRPIGEPFVVTAVDRNLLLELGGAPAAERLRDLYEAATEDEQQLMRSGLHVGIVADEYRDEFRTGDFLIRAVLGADPDRGAVAVGDVVELGRTIQFQVRDAGSADEDLRLHLDRIDAPTAGTLLFTCNGRGRSFFGEPDHDVSAIEAQLGGAVAGAFCAGEIGPVGTRSFVHGFTASMAVFATGEPAAPGAEERPEPTDGPSEP